MFRNEEEFKEWIGTLEEGAGYFTYPTYWEAVLGVSTDGAVVYDWDRMVDVLVFRDGMTTEEAEEWMDYNVVRTIPYCGTIHPVIVRSLE